MIKLVLALFFLGVAKGETIPTKCNAAYEALYSKPYIDILMIFGYKDSRPARFVGDRYDRLAFVQDILQPCTGEHKACGFSRAFNDFELFTRDLQGPKGQKIEVNLRVINSSTSADDEINRDDPMQKWQSDHAETKFTEGLKSADIVFYNGHSRTGGGPDFRPPRLTLDGANVDFSYYTANTPGLNLITKSLEIDKEKSLKLLGLFSCASSGHFSERIFKVRPDVGLVASRQLLYYVDALKNSMGALDAVLSQMCEKDFKTALRSSSPQTGSQVFGFFK